jgi:hypothetical protein
MIVSWPSRTFLNKLLPAKHIFWNEFEFETPALMHGNSSSDVIFVTPLEKK